MTADQDLPAMRLANHEVDLAPQRKLYSSPPMAVVSGYGKVAETIIDRARREGRFVHASPQLVDLLIKLDLDQHIPPALYDSVAELMAWIYCLEIEQAADGTGPLSQKQDSHSGDTAG